MKLEAETIQAMFHIAEGVGVAFVSAQMALDAIKRRREKRKNYLPRANKDARSYTLLHELRRDVGADRILLMRFHNGGKYADGSSINKISITQDVHPLHKSSVSYLMQSVAFDKLPHLIMAMTTAKTVDYQRMAKDSSLTEFFKLASIQQFYAVAIHKKGQVVGLLAVVTDNEKKEISNEDKNRILKAVHVLESLL